MNIRLKQAKRLPRHVLRNIFIKMGSLEETLEGISKHYYIPAHDIETPETQNMNFLGRAKSLKTPSYHFPGGYVAELNDVIYNTGDGTLTTPSRVILSDSINGWKDKYKFSIKESYFSNPKTLPDESGYSIFRSSNNGYYHTIIDNLPRLYLLNQVTHRPIRLLIPGKLTNIEKFFIDKLLPADSTVEFLEPGNSYLIKKLIFPSFITKPFSGYLPKEYLDFLSDRVLPKRPREKKNRIFISRGEDWRNSRNQRRRLLNEDAIFDKLRNFGFNRYRLENFSIEEQIALFYDAEFVVGAHGAGLSNTIFSKEIGVLELFASDSILPYYYFLSKALGHKYSYLYGNKKHIHADFSADVDAIEELMNKLGVV